MRVCDHTNESTRPLGAVVGWGSGHESSSRPRALYCWHCAAPNRPQYSKTGHGGAIATVDGYGHCSATSSAVWWRNRAARDPFGFRPMKTTWDQGLVNYGTRLASGEPGVKPRERRVIRCDSLSFMKQDSR